MIRSDVCVTGFAALALRWMRVPEPERVVSTTCFEALFADRDAFCFFVITRSFGISQMDIDAYHIELTEHMPTSLSRRPLCGVRPSVRPPPTAGCRAALP